MPLTISVKCSQPISQTVKPYFLNNLKNFAFNEALYEFRKYIGEGTYYDTVMFNSFLSLASQWIDIKFK